MASRGEHASGHRDGIHGRRERGRPRGFGAARAGGVRGGVPRPAHGARLPPRRGEDPPRRQGGERPAERDRAGQTRGFRRRRSDDAHARGEQAQDVHGDAVLDGAGGDSVRRAGRLRRAVRRLVPRHHRHRDGHRRASVQRPPPHARPLLHPEEPAPAPRGRFRRRVQGLRGSVPAEGKRAATPREGPPPRRRVRRRRPGDVPRARAKGRRANPRGNRRERANGRLERRRREARRQSRVRRPGVGFRGRNRGEAVREENDAGGRRAAAPPPPRPARRRAAAAAASAAAAAAGGGSRRRGGGVRRDRSKDPIRPRCAPLDGAEPGRRTRRRTEPNRTEPARVRCVLRRGGDGVGSGGDAVRRRSRPRGRRRRAEGRGCPGGSGGGRSRGVRGVRGRRRRAFGE